MLPAKIEEEKHFTIDFVDPMFAVALHIGLTEGIMKEPWFENWAISSGEQLFGLLSFVLAFANLVLSWVGYHNSIKTKPIKSMMRFAIDVILVILYAFMLVKYESLPILLSLIFTTFVLYLIWDIRKIVEYPEYYPKEIGVSLYGRYRREALTLGWTIILLGILIYSIVTNYSNKGLIIVLAGIVTFGFRYHKENKIRGLILR